MSVVFGTARRQETHRKPITKEQIHLLELLSKLPTDPEPALDDDTQEPVSS